MTNMDPGPGTFFGSLDSASRRELRGAGVRRHWVRGAMLFREGDRADRVLIVEEGTVKLTAATLVGVEAVLALRSAGDVLGELSTIDGAPRTATATATTAVTAISIAEGDFRVLLRDRAAVPLALLRCLADRLRDADRRRVEFGAYDTTARLAHLLAELASEGTPVADGVAIRPLSQEDLAGMCGASRESISRALGQLRAAGLVDTGRESITLRDPHELRTWGPEGRP